MNTKLYRYFNSTGQLLYVGVSVNAVVRMAQHRQSSGWYNQATRIEVTDYQTREEALRAELNAIKTENPLYNKQGKDNNSGSGQYTQFHFDALPAVMSLTTSTSLRLYLALVCHNAKLGSENNLVKITQVELAKVIKATQPDVSKSLKVLQEAGLVLTVTRGCISLNPKYIWKET